MKRGYDAIIIGAGHNGLVAAAYLAKAGKKVCVVEKNDFVGGCASTKFVNNKYWVSPAAYVVSLFQDEIVQDLKLFENGLEVIKRSPSSYTPDLNGPGLLLGHENERESIEKYEHFGNYDSYNTSLGRLAEKLEPLLTSIPPQLRIRDIFKFIKLAKTYYSIHDKEFALEVMTGSAANILNRYFKSDIMKGTLATDAIIGAFASPYAQGSAYVLLHHVMSSALSGKRGVWVHIKGGIGRLSEILFNICKQLGVKFMFNSDVTSISCDNGRVSGVSCGNQYVECKNVLSSLSWHNTLNKVNEDIPTENLGRECYKEIDYSSASAKINLVIDELPEIIGYKDNPGCYNGTIHVSPSLNYIEESYCNARLGEFKNPVLEITIPSVIDSSLSSVNGHHIVSMFVQYVPNVECLSTNNAINHYDKVFKQVLNTAEQYLPGITNSVIWSEVLLQKDLENQFGLTGGNIFQGAMNFNQLWMFRPKFGYSDHFTSIKGLMICGAAGPAGGGVSGVNGRNCAKQLLRKWF